MPCRVCGDVMQVLPSEIGLRFTCSKKCGGAWLSLTNSGENNPRWTGGYDPYYGPSWRPARRVARARDKVCQDCGISPDRLGKALDVHKDANRLDNLVSLCPTCHTTREWATNWRQP